MSEIQLRPGTRLKTVWHVNPKAITLNTIAIITEIKNGRITLDRGEEHPSHIPVAHLRETPKGWDLYTQNGQKCAEYEHTTETPKWLTKQQNNHETDKEPN